MVKWCRALKFPEGPEAVKVTRHFLFQKDFEAEGGKLDAEAVDRVFQSRKNTVHDCYTAALKEKKDLAGKIAVRLVIGPEGKVIDGTVSENTTGHEGVADCILKRARTFPFPKPSEGDVIVVRHFRLEP